MVVWRSDRQDGSDGGIFGQRFGNLGERIGEEVQISSSEPIDQSDPDVLALSTGAAMVAWTADGDGSASIRAVGLDPDNDRISESFLVSDANSVSDVALVATGQQSFLATYSGQDFNTVSTSARHFLDPLGTSSEPITIVEAGFSHGGVGFSSFPILAGGTQYAVLSSYAPWSGSSPCASSRGQTFVSFLDIAEFSVTDQQQIGNGDTSSGVYSLEYGLQTFLDRYNPGTNGDNRHSITSRRIEDDTYTDNGFDQEVEWMWGYSPSVSALLS